MATFGSSVHRPLEFQFPACGVAVLESHHAPDFRMEMASAPYAKVLHTLKGEGRLHLGLRSERLNPKCAWLIPPGIPHSIADSPGAAQALIIVCIDPSAIPPSLEAEFRWDGPVACRRSGLLAEFRRCLRAVLAEQSAPVSRGVSLVAQTLHLLALFRPKRPGFPGTGQGRARERVAHWLHSEGGLQAVSIDQAAEQVQLSRRSFTSAMRAITGQSWLQWQREQRIRHACRLLEQTARSVTSIAFECGFEDLSSFYRNFKSQCGLSPEAWRNRLSRKRKRTG
jgi:AraC family L-rhamnose operon regulatory protein RhaS